MLQRFPSKHFILYFIVTTLWFIGLLLLRFSGPVGSNPLWSIIGYSLGTAGMLYYFFAFRKTNSKSLLWFLCIAGILSRLLFSGYPVSDDFYRYTWEGFIQTKGVNPYLTAPNDSTLIPYRDATWEQINHKDLPAIYPPISMLAFRALADFYPSPEPWRLLLLLGDLITGFFLIRLLQKKGTPISTLALFALNPYILVFSIGEAHLDALQLPFLLGALYFFKQTLSTSTLKSRNNQWHSYILSATSMFLLGVSIFVKFWVVFCIPAFLHKKTLPWTFFLLVPLLLYGFYLPESHSVTELFYSLQSFSQDFTFNSLLHGVLQPWLGSYTHWIAILILASLTFVHLLLEPRIERNLLIILIGSFVISPTVHPWYLVLALPFIVLTPHYSLLTLTSLTFYALLPMYFRWWETGIWQEYTQSKYWIWIPFFIVLFWEWVRMPRSYNIFSKSKFSLPIQKVSIILPTWNEELRIQKVLKNIQLLEEHANQTKKVKASHSPIRVETIVVDGNSKDTTVEKARELGATVLTATQKGRGYQVSQGLQYATGDVTLFLHADCDLPKDLITSLIAFMDKNPHVLGGCHKMVFHADSNSAFKKVPISKKMHIIQWLNNFRANSLHIAFGDQVQFVRTKYAKEHHLVQGMPLMEDISLSLEIQESSEFAVHPKTVYVSTRKWESTQFSQNTKIILKLVFIFLAVRKLGFFKKSSRYFVDQYYKSKS